MSRAVGPARATGAAGLRAVGAPVVAVLVLTAACGSGTDAAAPAAPVAPVEAPSATATPGAGSTASGGPSPATTALRETLTGSAPVRYEAAAVSGTTLDGGAFDAADIDGPVVYWFWAPWCTLCRAEAPAVAEVAERWEGDVTFVGVASRGPLEDMEAFVADTGTEGIPHVADVDGTVWAQFGVSAQPAFVFVDRGGAATVWLGGLGAPLLETVAETLAG